MLVNQVTKGQRDIEREIRALDRQEKQMQLEAKKLANQGQVRFIFDCISLLT
jgi:hypothetical protein